jgi:hypothetical protein
MASSRKSRGSPHREGVGPNAANSSDDSGCLLILLLALWYFGFVSFHSRDRGRMLNRLGDVQAELSRAQRELGQISKVIADMQSDTVLLGARRVALSRQVSQLERTRNAIAVNLDAASKAISPTQRTRWAAFWGSIFNSVAGNAAYGVLLVVGAPLLRWYKRRTRNREGSVPHEASP